MYQYSCLISVTLFRTIPNTDTIHPVTTPITRAINEKIRVSPILLRRPLSDFFCVFELTFLISRTITFLFFFILFLGTGICVRNPVAKDHQTIIQMNIFNNNIVISYRQVVMTEIPVIPYTNIIKSACNFRCC